MTKQAVKKIVKELVVRPARKIMQKHNITMEELEQCAEGFSFEEFSTRIDALMKKKRRRNA